MPARRPSSCLPRIHCPRILIDIQECFVELCYDIYLESRAKAQESLATLQRQYQILRSMTYLQILEGVLRPKGFAVLKELCATCGLAALFIFECIRKKRTPLSEMKLLACNPVFIEALEEEIPNVFQCYRFVERVYLRISEKLVAWMEAYSSSPTLISRTPVEASRIYKAEVARGKWRHRPSPAEGRIRIHFYKTLQDGRQQDQRFVKPDACVDLDCDSRVGVDLKIARKILGVENLAVIADVSPFRMIFDPASQDNLSLLAAFDLSKEFREPIKVFERRVSKLTEAKRQIHDHIFVYAFFILTFVKSAVGFPLKDPVYASIVCGEKFVSRCTNMSQALRPLNKWACEGAWLSAQLTGFLLLLPFVIIYHAFLTIQFGIRWFWNKTSPFLTIQVIHDAAGHTFSFLASLSLRGWLIAVGISCLIYRTFLA